MDEDRLKALLPRARAGDAEAFADLYRAFSRRVFGLCRHLLGSTESAEDATSEVFLRAQRAMSSYDSALPFSRWLLAIAANHCVDLLRRRRLETQLFAPEEAELPEPAGPGPSPLTAVLAGEKAAVVRSAIERLPERYRAPLVLRYYGDLSYDEIGATLRLPRSQVATLIFRAKKELRRTLAAGRKELIV
ncbi:MAG: sigma-70 family RNA polymerase sigma factor [Acidobacteria bacterium]|nr:sigma-70 family RNA polymerase sigma factor [Acidobacteriota bacterium]